MSWRLVWSTDNDPYNLYQDCYQYPVTRRRPKMLNAIDKDFVDNAVSTRLVVDEQLRPGDDQLELVRRLQRLPLLDGRRHRAVHEQGRSALCLAHPRLVGEMDNLQVSKKFEADISSSVITSTRSTPGSFSTLPTRSRASSPVTCTPPTPSPS